MLRCLRGMNPTHCCFTATDLEDSLAEIESILEKLDDYHDEALYPVQLYAQKESIKKELEAAYRFAWPYLSPVNKCKPDKRLLFLVADILRQYGKVCFHENFFLAKQLLTVAINLQLYCVGIVDTPIDLSSFYSLEDCKQQVQNKPLLFAFMDDFLVTTSPNQIVAAAFNDSLLRMNPPQRLFALANTATLLGHAYTHLDNYSDQPNFDPLPKQLFEVSESLLLLIDDESYQKELAHLYFSTWPLFNRPNPYVNGHTPTLYEKTIAHFHTPEMLASVASKQCLLDMEAGNMLEAQKNIEKALSLILDMGDSGDPYLAASVYYTYATFLLEPANFDISSAEAYLKKATDFACQSRQAHEDRLCFSSYDERMAEVQYLLGNYTAAKKYITRALTTLAHYPESNKKLLIKIQALLSIVDRKTH